jgi:hypothetical protein
MSDDTLTMEGVEAIDLAETGGGSKAEEAAAAPETTTTEGAEEGLSSFRDAFAKAVSDEPETEKEPAESPDSEPSSSDSRSASDFKKIKSDRDTAQAELTDLKAKLTELENSDVDKVMDGLRTERDDLSQRLKLAAIERHPKFQKEFQDKVDTISKQAGRVVGEENEARVIELLGMVDSDHRANAIEELMMELSTTKQAQLGSLLTRVDEVRIERESALENADATYQQIVEEQQAQRDTAMVETNKLFDGVAAEASNLEVFATRDDDEGWNTEVKSRVDMARAIFSGENDPQELARASLWAAAAPKYRELLVSQIELNRRLRKQIGGNGTANPSMSGGGEGSGRSEPKSFADAYAEAMNS